MCVRQLVVMKGESLIRSFLRGEEECHVIHVIYPGCFEIKQCFSFIGEGKILKHCTKLNEASLYYLWVHYHGVRYLHNQSGFITPIKA